MVTIAIMIGTPTGTCLLAASSERDAAVMTEEAVLALPPGALPVPIWIQCADEHARHRLGRYLADWQNELVAVRPARAPSANPR